MIKRVITTTLPTTLAEGEEVYYRDGNGVQTLWVGNASGEAQRVSLEFSQASFTPTFTVDGGTVIATGQLTVTKIGNLVTLSGTFTIAPSGSPFDPFVIGTIPATYRPIAAQTAFIITGNDASLGDTLIPLAINTTGTIDVSKGFETITFGGSGVTIQASWTV